MPLTLEQRATLLLIARRTIEAAVCGRQPPAFTVDDPELSHDKHLLLLQTRFVALTHKGTERPVIIQVNRHLMPLSIVRPATGISASFGHPLDMRVAKASIPPLSRAGQDYHVRLPDCPGEYSLQVKLNFRYLAPHLLDELGATPLKHLLETVVIDEHESVIHETSRQ